MRSLMIGFLVVAMVAAGCGDDDDDAATPTTASSDSDGVASTAGADFEVIFDGEECIVTGPSSVPAGTYTFVMTDNSDLSYVAYWVREYLDGHTHQELHETQDAAGGPGVEIDHPPWVVNTAVVYDVPELDLADNQEQYSAALEPGPHGVNVSSSSPDQQWFCDPPFEVT